MIRPTARPGFTLIEILVVIAMLVILGAVLVPSMSGLGRDTKTKAAADLVQSCIADGRGKAIETGLNYRFAISSDGNRVRVAPEVLDTQGQVPDSAGGVPSVREDNLPTGVTIVTIDEDPPSPDANGWIVLATILNDGTCREDLVELKISEASVQPLGVRIRGLTGTTVLFNLTAGGKSP
ncbi:pilus assembly FimT family protein [Limnoglobus roseus]|uniref:Prepilin-type cleavage/methylation domain-containing protein n=1 Tax=Limnoglobus roseus TaxID=2598579 RepID=A0A5C1APK3_9BACT|nr:prepilin-type N-terminal cleavage/methylation domain-containing protein [Limnoglobus roseus]QEL18798.1 hypothetical protein PX52LOC_05838 [Limnoglobus roseus]